MVKIVRYLTSGLTRFVASITPVDTGAMRDSWTWTSIGLIGQVYISPSSHNPRTGAPVTSYASIVDRRVGLLDATIVEGERMAGVALSTIAWKR